MKQELLQEEKEPSKGNPMKQIKIDKVTLNIGAGKDQAMMEKGEKLLKHITGIDPVKTITQKRIAGWGLRPGLPIGVKITLRNEEAKELLKRLADARDNRLPSTCFDDHGNISFGIKEYIDIPGVKYDPEIGIIGFQVSVTLSRPGYRVKRRKIRKSTIHNNHLINKEEAVSFMNKEFGLKLEEE